MDRDREAVSETRPWPAARVLVAEDDDELRWLITRTLRKSGFDVIEARDGTALLDRAGEMILHDHTLSGIDLIVSDIRMPGWSGLDVLAGLKHSGVRVPMVLITAFGDDKTHDQAARLGAVAVVDKPFDMDQLCDVVLTSIQWKSRAPRAGNDAGRPRETH